MSFLCASLFSTVLYVFIAICILLLMVMIHEFGHYIVGRLLGFKINEFSVGFGKAIFSKVNKRGERISLRIFPLGGYCAFAGEDGEEENTDSKTKSDKAKELIKDIDNIEKNDSIDINKQPKEPRDYLLFNEQKPWKRILVYLAGVTFNFISAIIFSFILLVAFGYDIPQVKNINPSTIEDNNIILVASEGYELKENDIIWGVNGTKVNFAFTGTFPQLISEFGEGKDITLNIERDNQNIDIVVSYAGYKSGETVLDETSFTVKTYVHSFLDALRRCFEVAFGFAWVVLKGFWQIITGQIAFSQLGGPISTIGMITTVAQSNVVNFFILLPLLAANLAIFNVLPIPALDGSHAIFTLLEWIFRKPVVSREVESYIHFYGLIALLALVVVADIIHIIFVGF